MSSGILYVEVNVVCVLVLLLISIKAKKCMHLQSRRRGFLAVSISNMLLLALDAIWIFVESNALPTTTTWNWLLNCTYYSLSGLVGYLWFSFSETIQQSRFVHQTKYRVAAFLPALAIIVLSVLTYQNHLLFYIDANNVYHRGSAFLLQLVLTYGYIIWTATKAFVCSFHAEDYRKKIELRTVSAFIIPTMVFGSLQAVIPGYTFYCVGSMLSILYVYVTMQEKMVSLDALTQLNNRNQLYQYLSIKCKRVQENYSLYLLMLDIDNFKDINDQYGHTEGDKALQLVADCLRNACNQRNMFVSRYGGDEFTVVCELEISQSIDEVCDRIQSSIKEAVTTYPLSASIGYAQYTDNIKTQQELINLADKELYKNKKTVLRHR